MQSLRDEAGRRVKPRTKRATWIHPKDALVGLDAVSFDPRRHDDDSIRQREWREELLVRVAPRIADDLTDFATERREGLAQLRDGALGRFGVVEAGDEPHKAARGGRVVARLDACCTEVEKQARKCVCQFGCRVDLDVGESGNGHEITLRP